MKKSDKEILKAFSMITQIGFHIITPIGLCGIGGYYLDNFFHTQCWFIVLIILGVMAAFRNVYQLTRSFYEEDLKKEEQKIQYWKSLNGKQNLVTNRKEAKKDKNEE